MQAFQFAEWLPSQKRLGRSRAFIATAFADDSYGVAKRRRALLTAVASRTRLGEMAITRMDLTAARVRAAPAKTRDARAAPRTRAIARDRKIAADTGHASADAAPLHASLQCGRIERPLQPQIAGAPGAVTPTQKVALARWWNRATILGANGMVRWRRKDLRP
ncbi:hypothetical protein EB235_33610 [Mesorhizobium loti R88b]|uniref:Uncharacterized protein n=1 Tax=Mesorhizobium loti R88b TaxID=935548 RepID=A0A6M7X197_RHILI|nr:hypothetical protein EB235_33610 [Mesorhizobium loti R88b]